MRQWLKNKKNSRTVILAAAALILLTGSAAGRVMAYFTTYATAEGGNALDLNFTTTVPNEDLTHPGMKIITIQNNGNSACYVRVKVFAGSQCTLTKDNSSDNGWTQKNNDDGYYYWNAILPAKVEDKVSSTGALKINIDSSKITTDSFNEIVVQECISVPYINGSAVAWNDVDWTNTTDVIKTEIATSSETQNTATSSEPKNSDKTGEVNP